MSSQNSVNSPKQKHPQTKVIVFGASGNAGGCLVKAGLELGHQVTAFVRDPAKLENRLGGRMPADLQVVVGDALDDQAVAEAMTNHNAAIGAVGGNHDRGVFESLCRTIVAQAETQLQAPHRLWYFGGLPGLDIPHTTTMGADLPGMPAFFRSHKTNFEVLQNSSLDWSFICPGPMYFLDQAVDSEEVKITCGYMPYEISPWTRLLPKIAHPFIMKSRLRDLTVPYEDVARLIMEYLGPASPYSKKRVGLARPANSA